mmetsp:Transcript_25272/g.43162  ORF Transcript_25272/g.43162 Transcript_25272/m.43162 type:complete len:234 (+) Transcript_25272:405-1106(+)
MFVAQNFRRHPLHRSAIPRHTTSHGLETTQPKIGELRRITLVQQYIRALQVSMQHGRVSAVEVTHSPGGSGGDAFYQHPRPGTPGRHGRFEAAARHELPPLERRGGRRHGVVQIQGPGHARHAVGHVVRRQRRTQGVPQRSVLAQFRHDGAIRRFQTRSHEETDVGMSHSGHHVDFGDELLEHGLGHGLRLGRSREDLHGHGGALPSRAPDLTEAASADHVFQLQLGEGDFRR